MNRIKLDSICKRASSLALLFAAIFSVFSVVAAQSRTRVKPRPAAPTPTASPVAAQRLVTVNLKRGELVKGTFVRADAETVQLEVQRGRITIGLNEVASLVFAAEPAPAPAVQTAAAEPARAVPAVLQTTAAPPVEAAPPAALKAYTALRKLAAAAQVGLPYLQYSNLLVETKPVIEEALATLPETAIKAESAAALAAFTDAGQAWSAGQLNGVLPLVAEPALSLQKKYSIKASVNAVGQEDHLRLDIALPTIWKEANRHLESLSVLLNR